MNCQQPDATQNVRTQNNSPLLTASGVSASVGVHRQGGVNGMHKHVHTATATEEQVMGLCRQIEEQECILKAIPSILITIDESDRVTHWNPSATAVFGIPADQALGQPFYQCPIHWDWKIVKRGIESCRRRGTQVKLEDIRYTRPDGNEGIVGITLSPLGDSHEQDGRVLLLGADITERRLIERQLAQALKMESIGRLAAGIAHEINTPTQYVGDNVRFLQDAKAGAISNERIAEVEEAIENADLE
ncbi:MAG: hypothetical protein C4335_10075 [Armatimonadota bacterium]